MKKSWLPVLWIVLLAAALPADWTRRADIQGNITDIAIPDDHSEVYIGTDGAGVWWWAGSHWEERNSGLPDLRIRALVVEPDNPAALKAASVSGLVYESRDYGASWSPDSAGLDAVTAPFIPTDLSMAWNDVPGQQHWYTYMATLGAGVLRQVDDGAWVPINTGLTNMDILSVAACSLGPERGHSVLAGSRFTNDGNHPGHVYRYVFSDFFWTPVAGLPQAADYSVPSIAFHQPDLAMAALTVGLDGTGYGVYFTTDPYLAAWNQVCSRPPDHSFIAVDYVWKETSLIITAGTPFGLVWVDSPLGTRGCDASSSYQYFCRSRGAVSAVGLVAWDTGYAGGPGKGPIVFNPSGPMNCPVNRRDGLRDDNILDIAVSPYFGTPGGDSTVWAASGVAGVYKNVDPIAPGYPPQEGYFYRMIGDPSSWGIPPVLKIRPAPNYNETGCRPNRTVFAATNGSGVLRSFDGGRSWEYANGTNRGLDNGVVTDIAIHPKYDGSTNKTLWAAVYGKGVFESLDDGDSWSPKGVLSNPRVLCLAAAWNNTTQPNLNLFAGCRTNAVLGQASLFWWNDNMWSAKGGTTLSGIAVSAIGIPPKYPTDNCIFLGTENAGVMVSCDSGTNFSPFNCNLAAGAQIFDLKLAPYFDFSRDTSILIAVRPTSASDGGVYFTDGGQSWCWVRMISGLPDSRLLTVAFSPQYEGSGTVFCGHVTRGLYFADLNAASPAPTSWQPSSGFFNIPPNVTGLSVSPDDSETVYASTLHDGIFISRDGGDSFQPWGSNLYVGGGSALCPVPETLSVAVTHQIPPAQNVFLQEEFSGAVFPPAGWEVWDGGTAGINNRWRRDGTPCYRGFDASYPTLFSGLYAILDSDCEGGAATQDDWLVTYPMDTSTAQRVLLQFNQYFRYYPYGPVDHGYVKVCSSATGGNCSSAAGNWVMAADFTGQDYLLRSSVDLTPWKGTGMRVGFHYVGGYDWWWALDNVQVVQLLPRVVAGTKDHGIYYADAGDSVYFGTFLASTLMSGTVNELRYDGISEDMRASHIPDGDYSSLDYGQTWTQVPGVTPGLGLTDVSYSSMGGWGRGLGGFIWGCSSGKTVAGGRGLGDGRVWYYDPLHDCNSGTPGVQACWQQCPQTGLDPNEDYRAAFELNSGALLVGSIGTGSGTSWRGLYRSVDHCASWKGTGVGLPPSPMIYALYQDPTQGFTLASVMDSDTNPPDEGGVYYSDVTSDGRAWARTNLPSPAPGSRELAGTVGGTSVYSGQAEDGVFSTGSGSIVIAQPTAYFEAASEACVGQAVQFHDYSAGKVTTYAWTFRDGQTSTQANPSHAYASAATYYPSLTVGNGLGSDTYDLPAPGLTVRAELDLGGSLRAVKSGSNVLLSWSDLNQGETGYQVWASNSPSSGAPVGSKLGPDTTSTTVTGYAYWRVQPVSTSHVCGDGAVGGSW